MAYRYDIRLRYFISYVVNTNPSGEVEFTESESWYTVTESMQWLSKALRVPTELQSAIFW